MNENFPTCSFILAPFNEVNSFHTAQALLIIDRVFSTHQRQIIEDRHHDGMGVRGCAGQEVLVPTVGSSEAVGADSIEGERAATPPTDQLGGAAGGFSCDGDVDPAVPDAPAGATTSSRTMICEMRMTDFSSSSSRPDFAKATHSTLQSSPANVTSFADGNHCLIMLHLMHLPGC